jgi:hypothetical protein
VLGIPMELQALRNGPAGRGTKSRPGAALAPAGLNFGLENQHPACICREGLAAQPEMIHLLAG